MLAAVETTPATAADDDDDMFPRLTEARRRVHKVVQSEFETMREDLSVVGEAVVHEFEHIQQEMAQVRRWMIARAEEAPVFLRWNEFIQNGYRVQTQTAWDCVATMFAFHNETVNIWSHITGFAIMLALASYTLSTTDFKHSFDLAVFLFFFLSAAIMFLSSTLYHIFSCHSEHLNGHLLTCDYVGIFIMILGSTTSAYQVAFYCSDGSRIFYQTVITVLCISGIVTLAVPFFNEPKNFWLRVLIFVLAVGFSIVPVVHVAYSHGWLEVVPWLGILGLYAAGLAFYVSRFPECVAPGRFDYVLSSHQLWHVFIVLAALQTFYMV